MGQRQSVAGSFQGDVITQVLDLLETEHFGLAESFVPFVGGLGAFTCAALDAVRDDPACVGTGGFKASVSQVALGISMNPDQEIDPGALLFRQEAFEVAGQPGVALVHAQLDALPDEIIGQPIALEPLEQGVADLGPGFAVQPDRVDQRLKLLGGSSEADVGADVQALEADIAVFLVGIDQLGVLAALEQGAQPGVAQPAAQVGAFVVDDELGNLLVVRPASTCDQVVVVEVGNQRIVAELLVQLAEALGLAFAQGFQGLAVDRALSRQFAVAGFGFRGGDKQGSQKGKHQQPARILLIQAGRAGQSNGLGLELDHQSATLPLRVDIVWRTGDPSGAGQREHADP